MNKGQVWSIDILLAMVIFVSIMIIFYVTITKNDQPQLKDLESEAGGIKALLETNPDYSFMTDNTVNEARLNSFINETAANYQQVKQDLGVRGDFCIYLEDENGNLVLLQGNRTGIGSPDINITGQPCG